MVAYLTAPLKDRRHILRERDLRLGRLPARGNCREQRYNYDGQRDGSHTYLRERSLVLVSLPLFLYRTFLLYANSFVTYCMFAEARAGRRCKKIRACSLGTSSGNRSMMNVAIPILAGVIYVSLC